MCLMRWAILHEQDKRVAKLEGTDHTFASDLDLLVLALEKKVEHSLELRSVISQARLVQP